MTYVGRFAPTPSGPLHFGSLVAALASFLDARVHQGRWLLRIEDLDRDRLQPGAEMHILDSLARCGFLWEGPVVRQSARQDLYEAALARLGARVYPCACSRKEIADSRATQGESDSGVYPGTCRNGLPAGRLARAFRLRVPDAPHDVVHFADRWYGTQQQALAREVGDFVLLRADGFWAYQLAVVVDDAAQGITDVVRGADLIDSTARQIYLQRCLGLRTPRYLHVPIVTLPNGDKLSKHTGAQAFDLGVHDLLTDALLPAARFLGLQLDATPDTLPRFWEAADSAWLQRLSERQS